MREKTIVMSHTTHYAWLLAIAAVLFVQCSLVHAQVGDQATARLSFIDDVNIPTGTPFEQIGDGEPANREAADEIEPITIDRVLKEKASGKFGGISGIAYDAESELLFALSDSTKPVVFAFKIQVVSDTLVLTPKRVIRLTDDRGSWLPDWSMDPEALALLPGGDLLIASEGFRAGIPRAGVKPLAPAFHQIARTGRLIKTFEAPRKMLGLTNESVGPHMNFGIESLTLSPNATRLFAATEGTLQQDGEAPNTVTGSRIRICECRLEQDVVRSLRESVYEVAPPPVPRGFREPMGNRGLSELLALSDTQLLALERSFVTETVGARATRQSDQCIEIYQLDLASGTDVAAIASLGELETLTPVPKRLVLDLKSIIPQLDPEYQSLDNFEAMCFGPPLEDGSRTLLLVSDNNFNPFQRTVFLAFRLSFD